MREIFPLQKASIAYNEAIVGYNANADTYNFCLRPLPLTISMAFRSQLTN